jgi:hypothetical protein
VITFESMDLTCDPSRWPFDEARCRARTALSAYPYPANHGFDRRRALRIRRTGNDEAERVRRAKLLKALRA